ncbi:hypothetical protein CISIN_1g046302mg [Citrus sinensis]|uniref:Uncharacterized protein n=1 Tax=Citrus sinensis TaxID=2711 RepID=A0A067H8A1_CITSI|nr:hypothetical protein CISIN_1g046302mg [Citrus sinensis]
MKLIFSLLFFFFNLNFSSVLARGPERSLLSTSFSGSTGHLFEGNPSETSFDKAKGHVTDAELEKAVKEFRQRCSNISRICWYYFFNVFWICVCD